MKFKPLDTSFDEYIQAHNDFHEFLKEQWKNSIELNARLLNEKFTK